MQAMADERRTASPAAHVSKAQQNVLFCHFPDVLFCQHVTFSIGGRVGQCRIFNTTRCDLLKGWGRRKR